MRHPIAFYNGQWIDASKAVVPADDPGFLLGVTVTDRLRTFGGRLYRLQEHLDRLDRSLDLVGIDPPYTLQELGRIAQTLATVNHGFLDPFDDLNLAVYITPGAPGGPPRPLVFFTTRPIPFGEWADCFVSGQRLSIVSIRQIPAASIPSELKCHSRIHYYLADREARRQEPRSRALLLDSDGFVAEASTAGVAAYLPDEGIVAPPREKVLASVSLTVLEELAEKLAIPWRRRNLTPQDFFRADEVFLYSTSVCVLPVTHLDGRAIGPGVPGPVYRRLLAAWGEEVGLDIAAQAARFARRGESV